MDIQALFQRAWEVVTRHWYLIAFGTIIAVFGGGGGGSNSSSISNQFNDGSFASTEDYESAQRAIEQLWQEIAPYLPIILAVLCVIIVLSFAFWLLVTFARGALIGAVNGIENGNDPGFMGAVQLALGRASGLIGVSLITGLPGAIIGLLIAAAALWVLLGVVPQAETMAEVLPLLLGVTVLPAVCLLLPLGIVMGILQHFGLRAVMVEERGPVAALGRGWQVFTGNVVQAVVLSLIETGLQLVIGLVMIVPAILLTCTIVLIPVLWVVSGAILTYFNTLWTLAYRQWIGAAPTAGELAAANWA